MVFIIGYAILYILWVVWWKDGSFIRSTAAQGKEYIVACEMHILIMYLVYGET